jgi:hypothetical protein
MLSRRLTELERQEDRYIDAIADPDFPKAKITEKLRTIRDERARLQAQLDATVEELQVGRDTALRVLDYLDDPYALYERSNPAQRVMLNRTIFTRLCLDRTDERGTQVADDELTAPFASIVFLRRNHELELTWRRNEEGGIPVGDTAFSSRVLDLLQPMFARSDAQSSSRSTLAEDRGFEPLRGFPQPAFQASAIGH